MQCDRRAAGRQEICFSPTPIKQIDRQSKHARMRDDMSHVEVRVEGTAVVAHPEVLEFAWEALEEVLAY